MNPTQDQQARQRALSPHDSFLIQAPAGSGKTELLTQRFLRLLACTPNNPEEIIAITFTKKAAAEMRERIIASLQSSLEEQPSEPHKQLTWKLAQEAMQRDQQSQWNILANPNRLRIMTIDSLSMHINQFAPLLSGLGSQPRIMDDATALYQRATEALFQDQQTPGVRAALSTLLLQLDNRVEYAMSLLSYMLSKREQWLPHLAGHAEDKVSLRDQLEQGLTRLVDETRSYCLNQLPAHLHSPLLHALNAAGLYLRQHDPDNPLTALSELNSFTEDQPPPFHLMVTLANTLLTTTGALRKTVTKRQGFPAKSAHKAAMIALLEELATLPNWLGALRHCQLCPPPCYADAQWERLAALITLLPVLVAHLSLAMQESGGIDFTEITLSALRTLGDEHNPTDLALYFDHRIHHLLIDEFQDTSVTQYRLFEQLIAGWAPGDGRTLFLVGDPMQSIYRFRNAEVSLFLRAQHHGIGDITPTFLQLGLNFRSHSTVVHWVNTAFSDIMPKEANLAVGAVPHAEAIASNDTLGHIRFFANNSNTLSQYDDMISEIKAIPTSESIAILVRSRRQLRDIIPALQQAGVNFQAVDIEPLVTKPEIQDLLQLTLALLHQQDRIAWLSILRAPWCGLSLHDLHHLSQQQHPTLLAACIDQQVQNGLSEAGQVRLKHFINAILPAIQQRGRLPFHQTVQHTWQQLEAPGLLTSPAAHQNSARYFQLLLTLSESTGFVLRHELIHEVNKLYAADATAQANVHIMTIHKSKGLEFDHVLLPGLEHKGGNHDTQLLQWLQRPNQQGEVDLLLAPIKAYGDETDAIYRYLDRNEKQKLAIESTRLLYVACTRAKRQLLLFANVTLTDDGNIKPPRKGSHLHLLWPQYESDFTAALSISPKSTTEPEQTKAAEPVAHQCISLEAIPTSSLPAHSSYTDTLPQLSWNSELELARLTGIIIHEELQLIADQGIPCWQDTPLSQHRQRWQRKLRQCDISDTNLVTAASDKINSAIDATLTCTQGQWLLSNQHAYAASEYAISVKQKQHIKHLILDRFIVNPDAVWIIDYKTAQPFVDEDESAFIEREIALYRPQMQRYYQAICQCYSQPVYTALYFPACHRRWQPVTLSNDAVEPIQPA